MKTRTITFLLPAVAFFGLSVGIWIVTRHLVWGGAWLLALGALLGAVTLERQSPVSSSGREGLLSGPRMGLEKRVLIIGAGAIGQAIARRLEASGSYFVVGFIDDDATVAPTQWPLLGPRNAAASIVCEQQVDEVIIAYAPTWQQRLVEILAMERPQVIVRVAPSAYEALMRIGRVQSLNDIAVVQLTEPDGRLWDGIKRLLDILAASVILTLGAPFMMMAAALIKMTSPGPVLFAQERVGRGSKPFVLYKFRTMIPNAEAGTGPVLSKSKNDPRITPVGRWFRMLRIDELPQFWNVLRGEMSLVGPRPERPVFVERFTRLTPAYALRHEVRPGITGLAQVCGGYHTDPRDKLRFDLIYVAHRSLWLDIKILVHTVQVVLSSQGS